MGTNGKNGKKWEEMGRMGAMHPITPILPIPPILDRRSDSATQRSGLWFRSRLWLDPVAKRSAGGGDHAYLSAAAGPGVDLVGQVLGRVDPVLIVLGGVDDQIALAALVRADAHERTRAVGRGLAGLTVGVGPCRASRSRRCGRARVVLVLGIGVGDVGDGGVADSRRRSEDPIDFAGHGIDPFGVDAADETRTARLLELVEAGRETADRKSTRLN